MTKSAEIENIFCEIEIIDYAVISNADTIPSYACKSFMREVAQTRTEFADFAHYLPLYTQWQSEK